MNDKYQFFVGFILTAMILGLSYVGSTPECKAQDTLQEKRPGLKDVARSGQDSGFSERPANKRGRNPFQRFLLGDRSKRFETGSPDAWKSNIIVRGIVEVEGKPPTMLLEIYGEGVFLVKKGDQISLQQTEDTTSITVHDINDSGVLVKIMPSDQIIQVR